MNEAAEILVIFLSVALAIFLILGIITLSLLIKLLKSELTFGGNEKPLVITRNRKG